MAGKRRGFRRRKFGRRPPVPRSTQRYRRLAGQSALTTVERMTKVGGRIGRLARTVSTIAGLVNAEKKFVLNNISLNPTNAGDATGTASLNSIAEGDDETQRNGREVVNSSIDYRLFLNALPGTNTSLVEVSFMIVMDKKPTDTTAINWADMMTSASPTAMIDKAGEASNRYVVLKRHDLVFSPAGTMGAHIKGHIDLKGIHTHWNSTTGTSWDKNAFYIVAISAGYTSTNYPGISGPIRLNYYDN